MVTANKALIAHHGAELACIAEKAGVGFYGEAAVAGGIPILKAIREGLAGNAINRVYGILNGTCNYILSEMRDTGRTFDVLEEAKNLDMPRPIPLLTWMASTLPTNPDDSGGAVFRHQGRFRESPHRGHSQYFAARFGIRRRTRLWHQAARHRVAHR